MVTLVLNNYSRQRAAWKYAKERAAIAAKWTWLQAQISDLEHKIRQYSDLHKQIRLSKDSVTLDDVYPSHDNITPVSGYNGQLPGASKIITAINVSSTSENDNCQRPQHKDYQCTRTRPLINFQRRQLFQISGLHVISMKASAPPIIHCRYCAPTLTCALCTGRGYPTQLQDPIENLNRSEKINMIDPCFHPVFSLYEGWYYDLTLLIKEF